MHKQILRPKKESCSNGTDGPGRDKFSCRSPAVSQQITHLPLNTTGFYGVQTLSKTPSYFSLKIENKDNRLKSVLFSCTTKLRKNAAKLAATLSKSWSARSCLYSFTRPSPFYTKDNWGKVQEGKNVLKSSIYFRYERRINQEEKRLVSLLSVESRQLWETERCVSNRMKNRAVGPFLCD